ncbi:proline dehydrogenase 1, mitochondrial isoform X2 [Manduca sexta]|nr:proline dehydrogenase 1, mitochondrial isoform X1 [Manduca sexta]XP_037292615.1 proline dehydrogenase 1, mitochondrial isoform X2 [Manduca sexta]XP_037292668.1 proline dehydrogenase 1, mitochondrial isoform X2 [Manduca sexta]
MALIRRLAVNAPRNVRVVTYATQTRDDLDLTFNSPKDAFKSKKTSELVRAYFVYQICSVNWMVENNDMLMKRLRQVVGQKLFEVIMKATFYGQFVAGEDQNTIRPTIDRLRSFGVKSILDYSVEEDISQEEAEKREVSASISAYGDKKEEGQLKQYHVEQRFADRRYKVTSARTYFYLNEASCEKNMEAFLKSIDAVAGITKSTGLMAVKLTALGRPQLLLQLSEVIMRARNYMQQIAGGTGNVLTHHKTIEDFQRYFGDHKNKPEVQEFMKKITSDKEGVLHLFPWDRIVHLFPWSNILDEDMNLSDSFRVPDPKTGQMRRLISQISTKEEEMFRNMLRRLNHIIQIANDADVRIMIDAEQTYFQPAISRICLEMMRRYNKDKFLVFNTYQTYLKNTYNEILTDLEQAQRQNFYWGAKLVRGAYIEQERARAAAMGYEDPTCENVDATTASFHKCLKEILSRVKGEQKDRLGIMVASHNEDTVRYAIQLMKEHNIKPEDKVVCFGQLLGMCDHITFPLGQAGYSAYKYVPYGPVVEVLPYLSRRANENRGFLSKIKKEKKLLLKEIIRRVVTGQIFYKPVGNYTPV